MAFEQLQVRNVSDNIGRHGQVISPSHMNDERNYPITEGRAKQKYHYVVDATPDTGDVLNINALGETASLTIASETQAQAVDKLVAAFNANAILRGVFTATNLSDTTVVITANANGTDIPVTVTGTGAADGTLTEETEPANATQIPIGRAVYFDGSNGVTVTNPDSTSLDQLAGFTRNILDAEQLGIATLDTDLYEDLEDVCVMKKCRMIVDTGDAAAENDSIFIAQSGANKGKALTSSGATAHTLTLTPEIPTTGDVASLSLNIDGQVVNVSFEVGATETVAAVTAGLTAALDEATQATLLTTVDNSTDLVITLADPDASLSFTASDDLTGVVANDGTALKLPLSRGRWAGPNKIELIGIGL